MGKQIKKLLLFLLIYQEVSNEDSEPRLGRGYKKAVRLNPYNPLSYLVVILALLLVILFYGLVGLWEDVICGINPFKWD